MNKIIISLCLCCLTLFVTVLYLFSKNNIVEDNDNKRIKKDVVQKYNPFLEILKKTYDSKIGFIEFIVR